MAVAFPRSGTIDPTTGGRMVGELGIESNDIHNRNVNVITQSLESKCNWLRTCVIAEREARQIIVMHCRQCLYVFVSNASGMQ